MIKVDISNIRGYKMIRVAITVPKELLNEFDECLKKNRYNSRTKGMHEAMNEYIKPHK